MPRRLVIKLTPRVVPWGLTKVRCKVEVDINLLLKKEKNKILNQRTMGAKRAKTKIDREAQRAKDKTKRDAKKGGQSRKSKAMVASTHSLILP